ncbi:MAG: TonB-dependent receptor [Burkholderiales bacterium]|nr:TonB-dependent receptor [Burkholderiales bacterium]
MIKSICRFRLSILVFLLNSVDRPVLAASEEGTQPMLTRGEVKQQNSQKVEIQGKKEYDERRFDTVSKIVVTSDEILNYGDSNVSEVLKRLPGITFSGAPGRGGSIRMRGLSSGYVNLMLDGEPVPTGFSLDSLNPNLIERIEIVRSAIAEYSTQAIAGTINIVLKKKAQSAKRQIKAYTQLENGKSSNNLTLDVSDKFDKFSYLITSSLTHNEFLRPTITGVEDSYDQLGKLNFLRNSFYENEGTVNSLNIAPRINWALGENDTITNQNFINYYHLMGSQPQATKTIYGISTGFSKSIIGIDVDAAMLRSNINWVRKLADSAKLETKFGINFNRTNTSVLTEGYDAQNVQILTRNSKDANTDQGLSFSGKYSVPFVEKHAFVIGFNSAYSQRKENITIKDISPNITGPLNASDDLKANVGTFAVFAQDEWEIDKQWSVYWGGRWEGINTTSEGSAYSAVQKRSSVLSPILQTLWKLPDSKNDQLRLSIARTYKAPQTEKLLPRREIIADINNSPISPEGTGNPSLRPELSLGLDIAYEHYFTESGMYSISTYVRHIDDVIRRVVTNVNGIWVSLPVNEGQATAYGVESELKFPLRKFYKESPAIEMRANMNLNWSKVTSVRGPNNRLDSQTPFSANIGVDYKAADIPLTISGNYSFQTGGLVRLSESEARYNSPKRMLDISMLWKFNQKTQMRFSLSNLLQQNYLSQNIYSDDSGLQRNTHITPTGVSGRLLLDIIF